MNQDILSYIMNHAGSLSLQEILVNFIAAIAVGGVIFLSYRCLLYTSDAADEFYRRHRSWRRNFPFLPFFTFRGPLQWKIQRVPLDAHLSDHAGHVRHRQ